MKVRYTRTYSLGGFGGGFDGAEHHTAQEERVVALPDGVECPTDAEQVADNTPESDWVAVGAPVEAPGTE